MPGHILKVPFKLDKQGLIDKIVQNIQDDKEDENYDIQNIKPPIYAKNL